jgi:hypothetical protein
MADSINILGLRINMLNTDEKAIFSVSFSRDGDAAIYKHVYNYKDEKGERKSEKHVFDFSVATANKLFSDEALKEIKMLPSNAAINGESNNGIRTSLSVFVNDVAFCEFCANNYVDIPLGYKYIIENLKLLNLKREEELAKYGVVILYCLKDSFMSNKKEVFEIRFSRGDEEAYCVHWNESISKKQRNMQNSVELKFGIKTANELFSPKAFEQFQNVTLEECNSDGNSDVPYESMAIFENGELIRSLFGNNTSMPAPFKELADKIKLVFAGELK